MFQFHDYLRTCREEQSITQAELVDELMKYDECFKSLDATTLSRWERGVSKPSLSKQTSIARHFSHKFGRIYPFIEKAKRIDIENSFCALGFSKLLGKHNLVLNFPTQNMEKKNFTVNTFDSSDLKETAVRKNILMLQELYNKKIDFDQHMALAQMPGNYFAICDYDKDFYGHLFALKLKEQAFEKLMNFQMSTDHLGATDFASPKEPGHYLFFGFFGMSDLVISMLWIHFYSFLIKEQDYIIGGGAIIASKGGIMIAKNMNTELKTSAQIGNKTFSSFTSSTEQMLIAEPVVKMLFNPENCPEEA